MRYGSPVKMLAQVMPFDDSSYLKALTVPLGTPRFEALATRQMSCFPILGSIYLVCEGLQAKRNMSIAYRACR